MSPFERLGRLAFRHPWRVIGAWIAVLLVAALFAPRVAGALRAGGFNLADLESSRAGAVLEDELGLPSSGVVVMYEATGSDLAGSAAFEAAAADAVSHVPGLPHVLGIRSHVTDPRQVSADRHTAYDVVALDLSPDNSPQALPELETALRHPAGISVALAGGSTFYRDVQLVSEEDLRRAELVSLPLAALALLLVFGSVVAAGVPLVVGGATVVTALALIFGVASATPMSIFVLNLADPSRARTGRRLLAAHDQSIPRGAGDPRPHPPGPGRTSGRHAERIGYGRRRARRAPGDRGCTRRDRRHRRACSLLQRV